MGDANNGREHVLGIFVIITYLRRSISMFIIIVVGHTHIIVTTEKDRPSPCSQSHF